MIQAGVETLHSEIHKLKLTWNKEENAAPVEEENCRTYS
jgi:hypothetical protein